MTSKTMILFAHGARDSRWAAPFHRLREGIAAARRDMAVELAFLEFMEPDLPSLVKRLVGSGCGEIVLVPVFLGQGGHVLRDLPVMIEELRRTYPAVKLKVADAAGENEDVLKAIGAYCLSQL